MLWINIARLTWLEVWQNRGYKLLILASLFAPVLAMGLSGLFMVDIGKVFMDGIAGASQLLAIVFLLFIVVQLLSKDIFNHVCYILLTPPVTRADYFIGRFAGIIFSFLLLLLVLFLSSSIAGMFYIEQKAILFQSNFSLFALAEMLFFNFFQYISIIGLIFFIVSWSSGDTETMLFTVALLLLSWIFPPVLRVMQSPDVMQNTPTFILQLLHRVYEILPHLQGGDISLSLAHGISIGWQQTIYYILEHSLYGLSGLVLGYFFFKRRDL